MNIDEALQRARIELGNRISLSPVTMNDIPVGYDDGRLAEAFIFHFNFEGVLHVGASNYIAISQKTGEIISVFQSGE